jgi:hypothetical protein
MSTADEETIAALQTLVANIEELGHINIRDLLTPLLIVPRTNRDAELEAFEPDRERVERKFQQS